MEEYLNDFAHFRKIIQEGRIDNRTLVIELEDCLGIEPQNINSMTELNSGPQYHVRYKDIFVFMYWDESIMQFVFPNYFGICEGRNIKKLVYA